MEFEDIAKLINRVALEQKGRPLKDVERIVLKGAWENQTYSAMADLAVGYTEDYLKKDVGPKLWRLLSELIDPQQHSIKVTKRNIQNVLHTWATEVSLAFPPPGLEPSAPTDEVQPAPGPRAEPPIQAVVREAVPIDVSDFCGREEELASLSRWVEADQCRLILLWGLQGVGKTALAAKLAEQLHPSVDLCGYLALPSAITDEGFFAALVNWLAPQATSPRPTPEVTQDWIIEQLEQRRCLLLIDQMEHLFEHQQLAGSYRPGTEGVQKFFQQVAERRHRSCLVWISREKPADLSQFLTGRVRENYLDDLTLADAQVFLRQQGAFQASPDDWPTLLERYGSGPLLLRGLAATIQTVYQGQMKTFLATAQLTLPMTVRRGLEQTLEHLSPAERDLLYWLALTQEPISLGDLSEAMQPYPGAAVVQSLLGRSLCHVLSKVGGDATILTLKPVIRALVHDHLRPLLMAEIEAEHFDLLNRLPLVNVTAREVVQERQRNTLLRPLMAELQQRYPTEAALVAKCQNLHRALRQTCLGGTGYGAGNFIHICQNLGTSVSGVDFSDLAIWQADLRQVSLQGANFSQARFNDTVFATALGRSPVATFSHDGRYLATGDHEGRLMLWELGRGKLIQVLDDGGSQAIHALAFSPAGDGLAVGTASGQIWLWPLGGTYRADSLSEHSSPVRALAFSPQGDRLISGDDSGKLCLWDLASGMCESTLSEHQGAIHSLAFNSQGDRLVSGGDDQRACLWDIHQKTLLSCFQAPPTAWVRTAGFLPDPEDPDCTPLAFAAGYDEQCLTIWDLAAGRPCWILPADVEALPAMAISPNGRYLVCSRQDFIVAVWDIPTRTPCYSLPPLNSPVWMLGFSPDSRYFVTGSDYTLQLWGTTTGHCVRSF
ncbi:MAG: AAA family ATPase [Leptolyngbyaceae cyanobacterium SM2_3_12]|nr:AAA family ATPase [Leptolyngbyaceae cyanobacterium SM2_3_12]